MNVGGSVIVRTRLLAITLGIACLQVLSPFLHAHAFGRSGGSAGLHLHVERGWAFGLFPVVVEHGNEASPAFSAQEGKRLDLDYLTGPSAWTVLANPEPHDLPRCDLTPPKALHRAARFARAPPPAA